LTTLLTAGYDPTESAPEIYIYDFDGVLKYTYQTAKTQASPTQDFRVTDLEFTIEGNGSYGHATILIEDNAGALLDTTSLRRRCLIKKEWKIIIKMGKNNAGLAIWFQGKIKSTPTLRPGTALERVQITATGWGEILKNKVTTIKRNQDKAANGIDLDDADTKTRLDNLIIDMFEDTDHYIDNNIPQISTITYAVAADGLCAECLNIKVANVNEFGNSFAGFISRMCGIANVDWYVSPDRALIVRDGLSYDSGFLITNNLTGLDAVGWDSGKLMYILNEPIAWDDNSFDTMYSWIHGMGHFKPTLDVKEETLPNASDNVDDEWIAIPFTPVQDNIFKIALRSIRTGTPAQNATIEIRGDDGAGKPDLTDIRRTLVVTRETLQALGTTVPATWLEIPVSPKLDVEPDTPLWIVLKRYGSASHTYNINYKSGSGTYYVSTDDITYNVATGLVNYRIYSAKRLRTSVENTVLSQKLDEQKEKILPIRSDLEEQSVRQAMIIASEALGKVRRVYDNVICSMPDDRIPLAAFLRFQDLKTGLDIKAVITGYNVEMHAGDVNTNLGATQVTLTLDDVYSV
jgi:hypothetical protein